MISFVVKKIEKFIVSENSNNKRLDLAICENFSNLTRSYVHKLICENRVFLNNKIANKHQKVNLNDEIVLEIPEPKNCTKITAQNIKLNIIYEDEHIIVINKHKGMVVHPAPGHYDGTLVNALMWHCKNNLSNIGGVLRPGIVHRIDKDTSGLMLVAKTNDAYYSLVEQLKNHSIKRTYEAIVYGKLKNSNGILSFPIGRHKTNRQKMAVNFENGKIAITNFELIKQFKQFAHIKLNLKTGRTHQIRVHMAHIHHPVVGDTVYGPKNSIDLKGQCLHSKTIEFFHFKLQKRLIFTSELEENFIKFLAYCEQVN